MKPHLLALTLACLTLVGCSEKDVQVSQLPEASGPIEIDEMPPIIEMDGHPEFGPHGGELVELGKEAFHIEMLHGSGAIAMYVLDGSATQTVAIEADKLTVSLKHDGEVKSFELSADPQAEDTSGKSSSSHIDRCRTESVARSGGRRCSHLGGRRQVVHRHDYARPRS